MVVVIKYAKTDSVRYTSHNDIMRQLQRTVRRMGAAAELSAGFNPHMLTYSSPPLPLGLTSEAEYFTVVLKGGEDAFQDSYRKNCHPGLPLLKSWILPRNPNLAGKVTQSAYRYFTTDITTCKKPKEICEDYANLVRIEQFIGDVSADRYLDEGNNC